MKRRLPILLGGAFLLVLAAYGLRAQGRTPATAQGKDHFDKKVAPLLANRCLECHSGARPRGGLDLTSRKAALDGGDTGPAVVPGDAAASLVWKHVNSGKMPPKKPLDASEKQLLKQWIEAGVTWGTDPIDPFRLTTDSRAGYDWWSLQPVTRPALPKVKHAAWPRNAIDHFILADLEEKGLTPAPEADRRTLIRRLSFDLIGLPPTPDEVEAFVKDQAPDAYEKLVERLLASPHHGERWARHWLDLARFGESNGFEFDELRPNAWPYRDWVIRALNQDMAFDQFARLQLAGDVLLPGDPQGITATGFLVAGSYDTVGQQQQSAAMRAVVRQDELEDMAATVGQAFLGLTVHCARCHDHKFDAVRQAEYYRLTAALGGVSHGHRDIATPAVLKAFAAKQKARQAELAERLTQLKQLEEPVRKQLLAERKQKPGATGLPEPLARWDFTKGLKDERGDLHANLRGDAQVGPSGLLLSGQGGYAETPPLAKPVQARTLVARLRLANLTQRGGAAISLQTPDGQVFDAIVFGEQQTGHWMAGSDFYRRTKSLQATPETAAVKEPVHFAIVYAPDGTVTAYRNGQVFGKPYQTSGPVKFEAGKAQLLFGLRHTPAQPGRLLAGNIVQAALYDVPLSAQEVAALAAGETDFLAEKDIVARLDAKDRARREQLVAQIRELEKVLTAPPPKQLVYAVVPKTPAATHVLLRGNPGEKGAAVTPGGVAALAGPGADFGLGGDASDAERRRKLAEWVTHPQNPLFGRVIVNRVWQHHFGTGLVETPNDFGFNGGRPSHPALLDWLADELVRQKYSLKALHRLMVTSAAYRQSSRFDPQAAQVDAGNRLLWRKSPVRLEAEVARDTILAVAGQLDLNMGGPGFQDFKVTVRGSTYYYEMMDRVGAEFQRRTIYRTWARGGRSPLLDTLDCPDPSTATHRRSVTTTPLQALTLLNSSFTLRLAGDFARRVRAEAGEDVAKQVGRAYALAYGRAPTAEEVGAAAPAVRAHGLAVLCRALLNSNEFLHVD